MKNINMEDIIISMLKNNAKLVNEKQIMDAMDQNGLEHISAMVFLPSGNGLLMFDEEQAKTEEDKNGL